MELIKFFLRALRQHGLVRRMQSVSGGGWLLKGEGGVKALGRPLG